ncbi:MAG: hypothetical protein C3F16_00615 [Betaproteobacteria bacterium]|nr:MAG: hypothetical protein C3F16_00615 [Betaproteobacteria bacterium]
MRHWLMVLAATAGAGAVAANHETVSPAIGAGPFAVACSNVAQDESLIAALGSTPQEIWEGRPRDGQGRYVSQVLAAPGTAIAFEAPVPDQREIYPRFAGGTVPYVAIVCHPTPRSNPDPDYVLPGTGDVVPRMQRAGAAPRLLSRAEYLEGFGIFLSPPPPGPAPLPTILFSHGLGGSPISPGYLAAMVDLASQGFLVAGVFHGDPRFSRIRIEDLRDLVSALAEFDEFVELELLRPVSLRALLDALLAHPGFAPGIDRERIAGFGASLGGQAMANLLGARLTVGLGLACRDTVTDPRVKAAVGLVPYAGQTFLPSFCNDQVGAWNVERPYLAISGTADSTAPIGMMEQALNRFRGSRYLVALEGIGHGYTPDMRGDVMTWTVGFLEAYLRIAARPDAIDRFIRLASVAGGTVDSLRVDAHAPFPPGPDELLVREFYSRSLNHFVSTGDAGIIADLLAGGWLPTADSFKAYSRMPPDTLTRVAPVCHFYGVPAGGPDSRFYTVDPAECALVRQWGGWHDEGTAFHIQPTDAGRRCPAGHLEVVRHYNWGYPWRPSNHRYTTSDSTAREMDRHGWLREGTVMCARP